MADTVYQILLKFIKDDAQAKQAQSELDALSKSTQRNSEAEKDALKVTEKSNLSRREQHELLHLVGRVSGPQAEAAIAGIGAASTGELALGILAVKALAEGMDHLAKSAQEADKAATTAFVNWREQLRTAAEEQDDFNRAMDRHVSVVNDLTKAFDVEKAALNAVLDGHKQILDAIEKEQLAAAQGDKVKEEMIKKRFEDLKKEYDLTAEATKLDEERGELAALQKQSGPLHDTAVARDLALQDEIANRAAGAAETRVKGQNEEELSAQVTAAKRMIHGLEAIGVHDPNAEENLRVAELQLKAFRADQKTVEEHTAKVKALTKAKDDAVKDVEENRSAIESQTQKIKTGEAELTVHKQTDQQIIGLQRFMEGNDQGSNLQRDLLAAAGFTTQAQYNLMVALQKHEIDRKALLEQIITMLEHSGVNTKEFQNRINRALQ